MKLKDDLNIVLVQIRSFDNTKHLQAIKNALAGRKSSGNILSGEAKKKDTLIKLTWTFSITFGANTIPS